MGTFEFVNGLALAVAGVLIGVGGWANVSPTASRVCFILSALIVTAICAWWGLKMRGPDVARYLVTASVGAALLSALVWGMRWTAAPVQAAPAAPGDSQTSPPPQLTGRGAVVVNGPVGGDVASSIVHNTYNQTIIRREPFGRAEAPPRLHSPKIAMFYVERAGSPSVFDIGLVVKLFNLETRPLLIQGIGLENARIGIHGRGSWYLQALEIRPPTEEVIEDRFIKAGEVGYYKLLLPVEFKMTRNSPSPPMPTPEMNLAGTWSVGIDAKKSSVHPELQSTAEFAISGAEWDMLLKPASKIDIENLKYTKPVS